MASAGQVVFNARVAHTICFDGMRAEFIEAGGYWQIELGPQSVIFIKTDARDDRVAQFIFDIRSALATLRSFVDHRCAPQQFQFIASPSCDPVGSPAACRCGADHGGKPCPFGYRDER